jgi:hypothetical protein
MTDTILVKLAALKTRRIGTSSDARSRTCEVHPIDQLGESSASFRIASQTTGEKRRTLA